MKRIILLFLAFVANVAIAQTFPVQNLTVNGTASFVGASSFTVGPTAPTASVGTNTTQLATTAYVVKHAPCQSIMDYGGNNGGAGDNTTAFANTVAASPTGQACVYFPPGLYAFSGQVGYTFPNSNVTSITIVGAGQEVTTLYWANSGGGLAINLIAQTNSVHVRDLALAVGTTAGGTALALNQTVASAPDPGLTGLSDITNVTVRGIDNYAATDYWTTGVVITGVTNVNFISDAFYGVAGSYATSGTGVNISGSAAVIPVQINFIANNFQNLNIGIQYGTYTQGVSVANSNFTADTFGIYVPGSETGLNQLAVTSSQFNCASAGIGIATAIPNVQITNSLFIVPNLGVGIQMSSSELFTITGNSFTPAGGAGQNGVVVAGTVGSLPGIITGNSFYSMAGSGIFLQSTSTGVNVQSNVYKTNGTNVTNSGTGNTVGAGSP